MSVPNSTEPPLDAIECAETKVAPRRGERPGPGTRNEVQVQGNPNRRRHGQGSLYQVNGKWVGHWRSNGRQVKRTIGLVRVAGSRDGLTEPMAEKALRELIVSTEVPRATGEKLNVHEVSLRYRAAAERKGRKRSTLMDIESHTRVHFVPYFGDRSMASITPEDVQDFVWALEGKSLKPKTVHNLVGTLASLFNYATLPRNRWVAVNPCEGVEMTTEPQSDDLRFLNPDELERLIEHARPGDFQEIDRAMYLTAAMTGMRKGELIALRWGDVDWEVSKIRVRQNFVRGEFGTPKTRRSFRSVPLADEVAGVLHRLWAGSRFQADDDLVFAHPASGDTMSPANVTRRMKKSLAAAGFIGRPYVFHDLRHTFGTRMAAAGAPLTAIKEWMGHRDIATTQRYADYMEAANEAEVVSRAFARVKEDEE